METQPVVTSSVLAMLSPPSRDALAIDANRAYEELVATHRSADNRKEILSSLSLDNVLVEPPRSPLDASAVLSGLWLWHDFLDESHRLSQGIETETGSFWHAIMHRREGDFSNSKYWYARCARHPALVAIEQRAASLGLTDWNPRRFVDLVEEWHRKPDHPNHHQLVALQRAEWIELFSHTVRAACGLADKDH